MASIAPTAGAEQRREMKVAPIVGAILVRGVAIGYVSIIVLLPMAALLWKSTGIGWSGIWATLTVPYVESAFELTIGLSALAVLVNAIFGTILAWVLARDEFPGKKIVNSFVDLPFALPTVVAGLTIVVLYGSPYSPVHVDISGTRAIIALALLFVTLPFVTRAVQPVLLAMDHDMEEAAAVLGASKLTTFRKIILPNIAPALLSGAGLAFARALGEFGSVIIVASNLPFKTQMVSLVIFSDIEQLQTPQAAALSVALLVLSLAVLIVFNILSYSLSRAHRV